MLTGSAVTKDIEPIALEPVELQHVAITDLQALPMHYSQIILLRDLEGQLDQEITAMPGVAREVINSRLQRARVLAWNIQA
jgi:DNA-directed RNA polymerase specialized sigma24 family protein